VLKNYLKIALRNIRKHPGYSIINIAGLAIGLACCLFILIWVLDELSYDKFHENAPYLYRVEENQYYSGRVYHVTVTPYPLAPALKADFPEIIEATQYVGVGGQLLRYGEKAFFEPGMTAVTPAFFRMFTFPFVKGDSRTALDDPFSLVISEEIAEKYFGEEDPIGKAFSINNRYDMKVTGVMKNVPNNSYLHFDMVIPYALLEKVGAVNDSMGSNSIASFVQLQKGASLQQVNDKIRGFIKKHVPDSVTELELALYSRIHLHQYFGYGRDMGQIKYVYIFSLIAFFVLLIACINFMNLTTARSIKRAKEVGIRKVVGAQKNQLIRQFLGESLLLSVLSALMAILIVTMTLPLFNRIAVKDMLLNSIINPSLILGIIAIALAVGLLAGIYPAFVLSSFQPIHSLKSRTGYSFPGALLRKGLVIFQFALSIGIIFATLIAHKQMFYIQSRNLGYDKEQIIVIP